MSKNFHKFHIVDYSPWPLITSMNIYNFLSSFLFYYKFKNNLYLIFFLFVFMNILLNSFMWWRDVIRESTFQGFHTNSVLNGIKLSMILFITSEVLFFFSFFWSFFNSCLSPDILIGMSWPPYKMNLFNPYLTPFLNTMILIISGITITWSHNSMFLKNKKNTNISLMLTIYLAVFFTLLQVQEYSNSNFSMNDSILGSTFYVTTGFHGLHVIIGSMFITYNFYRSLMNHLNNKHHFSLEAAIWYWHFVDIIWLFLFTFMYWWFF